MGGCSDLGDPVTPDGSNGDGNLVRYENDVKPIFLTNCAKPGCHTGLFPAGDLDLSTYEGLMDSVGPHAPVVRKFDPDSSYVILKLNGDAQPQMPLNAPALPPDTIAVIYQWILEGAVNN